MSDPIQHIQSLAHNSFAFSPLLVEFYSCAEKLEKNVLLSYVVIPLLLNKKSYNFFHNANKNSTLITFIQDKERQIDIQSRVSYFKHITHKSLQFCVDTKAIHIDEKLSVHVVDNTKIPYTMAPKSMLGAARKMGKILSEYAIPHCYQLLGVHKI